MDLVAHYWGITALAVSALMVIRLVIQRVTKQAQEAAKLPTEGEYRGSSPRNDKNEEIESFKEYALEAQDESGRLLRTYSSVPNSPTKDPVKEGTSNGVSLADDMKKLSLALQANIEQLSRKVKKLNALNKGAQSNAGSASSSIAATSTPHAESIVEQNVTTDNDVREANNLLSQVAQLQTECKDYQATIQLLKGEYIKAIRNLKITHAAEGKHLQEYLGEMKTERDIDQATIKQLRSEIIVLNSELKDNCALLADYTKMREELEAVRKEASLLKFSYESLTAQVDSSKGNEQALNKIVEQKNNEVAQLKVDMQEQSEIIRKSELALKKVVEQKAQMCQQKDKEIDELKNHIQRLHISQVKMEEQLKGEVKNLTESNLKLEQEVIRVKASQVQAYKSQALKRENECIKSECTKLTEDQKSLKAENNDPTKQVADTESKLKALQNAKPAIDILSTLPANRAPFSTQNLLSKIKTGRWSRFPALTEVSNVQPLVIDCGSYEIKAGYASNTTPEYIQRTNTMVPEDQWQYTFKKLKINPAAQSLLLTEALECNSRGRTAQIMFETYEVPALCMTPQSVLALYSTGRTTGIVLESGHRSTHAVPIYEGHIISHAVQSREEGGSDLTEYMLQMIQGLYVTRQSDREVARDAKERFCFVSLDVEKELQVANIKGSALYNPCEKSLEVIYGKATISRERFQCPEKLFNPLQPVHRLIADAINRCDGNIEKELYANVVLAGGNTRFPGFAERLQKELRGANIAASDRYAAWIGGSILASLPEFDQLCVSKEEYEESGEVVCRKFF
eukprot:TRINITY_DN11048_c0_g1_i1.p1 TRINITY_DN11048_c0_g1~~TRINITY_DN11048_c0_g1_i1.p1  ORF type:complete len:806 (-),score=85.46 TRINITY_DN11048_c0_g1_i1:335-2725(-)